MGASVSLLFDFLLSVGVLGLFEGSVVLAVEAGQGRQQHYGEHPVELHVDFGGHVNV